MLRSILAAVVLLVLAPLAVACNCASGGECHCGDSCSCGDGSDKSDSTSPMTAPQITLFAADTGATTVHVGVENFDFTANAVIHAGDTVQWDWINGFHTVTSVLGSAETFDSGFQSSGSFSHTFVQPGTYEYYCQVHGVDNGDGTAGGMVATVTVLPVPEPASVAISAAIVAIALAHPRRTA